MFDADNLLPSAFYSTDFVERLRDDVLGSTGFVVQNFHTGNDKLYRQLKEAEAAFGSVFDSCSKVNSLDSKENGGNTIILASKSVVGVDIGEALSAAARRARHQWGLSFDASWRVKRALHVTG